jgi:exopolyphosphatase/guanosine-5'-triphosphate,3'-diphosphate pyrophosphatase
MKFMQTIRRAVIDVGTNSVKLLVADVLCGAVQPVLEKSEQTRLGAGFFATNCLQPQAVEQTARAVAAFAQTARESGAVSTRIIATSAARDAVNAGDLASAIQNAAGLKVEIISGQQEADLAFQGVNTDPELAQLPLLLLDVGGGSTEFILGQGEQRQFCQSFQLGTVRLMEKFPPGDPPAAQQLAATRQFVNDFLCREVRPALLPLIKRHADVQSQPVQLVGTGGTATILARLHHRLLNYNRAVIEGTRLDLPQLHAWVGQLWGLPLAERKKIPGLPPSRADVILYGTLIYEGVMDTLEFSGLRISTRGLRFAAVLAAVE